MHNNIDFRFDNCCLALKIEGDGKIIVHENTIRVKVKKGRIKLNPELNNQAMEVGFVFASLGTHIDFFEGSWNYFNPSKKVKINQTIQGKNDYIDISGIEFDIPYSNELQLQDTWIVLTTLDPSEKKYNYAHSAGKVQKFKK